MSEITSNLNSVAWWFTAVLVAVLVNLVSAYLKDGTDRVWRFTRRKLQDRKTPAHTQARSLAESNAAFLEELKSDESHRRFLFEAELRARLLSLELIILALACAAIGFYFMVNPLPHFPSAIGRAIGFFSAVLVWASTQQLSFALALSKVLLGVERLRRNKNDVGSHDDA